ncbi:uncharacterized protein LOC106470576 [Limulus polyphemus]|uniref:Uncharacterized protein LOC106470576 n=1 Tax=Limulus polyphemus TaxID=6850 RepID=A0ABM1BQA5_LIMPO|nr:uncharacterized protein LOC106470576 [Limulus polyphemus]XP_013786594.1 uncharacterized protein LOC106470576 [Limulus polyphemus]XP_022254886.1 uncharacterized protein LOC106470576 [Limulus polyphemus]XP_022254887.1 uncharacterized protein LOC106470576 [Limulus polyphemus]XP_022254888.1 uncharacterized protein LOC106470576 [Limulus polyphemus]
MGLIGHRLRRFIRSSFRPIQQSKASTWDRRLGLLYIFFAWNACGAVIYFAATGRADWAKYYGVKPEQDPDPSPAHFFARKLGVEKSKIINVKGFDYHSAELTKQELEKIAQDRSSKEKSTEM